MKIDGEEVEINVVPTDLWGFFNRNSTKLKSKMVCIANNPATNVEVYLTEEYAMPSIIVFEKEEQIYKEPCSSAKDAEFTLKDIYKRFLFPKKLEEKDKVKDAFEADGIGDPTEEDLEIEEELTRMEREDIISEREDELSMAFEDFMLVVLNEDAYLLDESYNTDELNEMLSEILTIISNHAFPVYRPMFVQDIESNTEVYSEYPYESYEFVDSDDEDDDSAITSG